MFKIVETLVSQSKVPAPRLTQGLESATGTDLNIAPEPQVDGLANPFDALCYGSFEALLCHDAANPHKELRAPDSKHVDSQCDALNQRALDTRAYLVQIIAIIFAGFEGL